METDDVRLSRKEQEKEARKKDILNAAANLFSTRGFHEVKVDDIADQVGLSKGTIYLYFENKEKLFYSIIFERTLTLEQQLNEYLQCDLPFIKCLKSFVETYFAYFQQNEAFFKILQSHKSLVEKDEHFEMHHKAREAYMRLYLQMVSFVKRGQQQNIIRAIDPVDVTKMLWGMLHAFTFNRIMNGSDELDDEHETDHFIDLFLNGVKKS
ncbi:TetR/AcrR family transcriptional regulator [candidate division KSB1 bacterium]|nr:TetR/AcrR family transcriptional regulator [candidate division KSB1 bacterium]